MAGYGSELIYLLGLAFLLLGTALGTLGGRLALRGRPGAPAGALFLAVAVLLPGAVALARGLHRLLGGVPGAFLSFPAQLAGMALVLLPVGLVGGALFQRAAAGAVAAGSPLATAYALESVGGLAGGAAGTLLLATGWSNLDAALLAALVAAAAALLPEPAGGTAVRLAALAVALALAGALLVAGRLDRAMTGWNHPGLVATRDTPYGRATVTRAAGQLVVFENGALSWESEGTTAEELVHVAALAAAAPRAVLVLGGTIEGLVPEVLSHRPQRVDVVELDRALIATVLPLLPERTRRALAAPAVRRFDADPRAFLARPGRYDLVVVALPQPDSGQANRFYTREFYAACARRLAPGGVLALRLQGAENLWTPALARRNASVHRALGSVFPAVAVLPGTTHLVLASNAPLDLDPELLAGRLAERGIASRLVSRPYLRYLTTNDRRLEIAARLRATSAPANRDGRPICYQLTLLLWLARFFPELGQVELPGGDGLPAAGAAALVLVALFLVGLGLLVRHRARPRRWLLAAAAGGVGMVLEGAVLLDYQARRGALFQDLGLLLTLFMAGLALGSWRAGARPPGGATRRAGAAVVVATAALCGTAAALLASSTPRGLVASGLLLLATGSAVGALFGFASRSAAARPDGEVAPLYAADLVGGSLGALVGSLALLPLLGPAATALLVGGAVLVLLLLV